MKLVVSALVFSLLALPCKAEILEPDRKLSIIGNWTISTARWGAGCVAEYRLSSKNSEHRLLISRTKGQNLSVVLVIDPQHLGKTGGGFLEGLHLPEIVLSKSRWTAEEWSYRGEVGVHLEKVNPDFVADFMNSQTIRMTENGTEKVALPLDQQKRALEALGRCLNKLKAQR